MNDAVAAAIPALDMRGVHKRFGDTTALDGASLVARTGTVHALLGENGAGKSTLMRIAFGLTRADAGDVVLLSQRNVVSVRAAMDAGAGMVHQHLSLVPALTAAENLALGGRGLLQPGAARSALRAAMDTYGLRVPADARVSDLTIVEQQRLEILKALTRGARLLILDEPTAVLAPSEAADLLRWLRRFAANGGTVVLVTHKLGEAIEVADDITVLRRGKVALACSARDTSAAELARAIFPEEGADDTAPLVVASSGEVVVSADAIDVEDARGAVRIRGASFALRAGEIVGVAAVEGSGHPWLLRALAGRQHVARGTLRIPADAAIIPADRLRDALVPEFTLTENVALHGAGARRGLVEWRDLARRTGDIVRRFGIVTRSVDAPARALSGGNQQRLVVGRELEHARRLIVADNPTRGLDLRATSFVHEQLRAAAAGGATVVLHASDLDDILPLASRVLVVFHGEVREVPVDRDVIGRAMLGSA